MIVDCPSCQRSNRLPAARMRDKANCAACKTALLPLSPFEELREGDAVAVECPPEHLTLWRV